MKNKYTYNAEQFPREQITGDLAYIDPICLDILWRRGFRSESAIKEFLYPSFSTVVTNTGFKDFDKAIAALKSALTQHEKIIVYQDYDADGCCACAIAVECLRTIGGNVGYYCNDRAVDGFGLCINGVDNILEAHPDAKLIITVDNGIVANEAVAYANSKGLTVVITDHHEPGAVLPDAAAVVNAKRKDEEYPYHDFCGAGIIFKLMLELYRAMGQNLEPVLRTADIATLATVADVVPLTGENRAIVKEGLRLVADGTRPAFNALNRVMKPKVINAQRTLAFTYAPMVNALSRMGKDPSLAVELLLSTDDNEAGEMVLQLKALNEERKEATEQEYQLAEEMIDPDNLPPVIVLYNEQFREGLVGIIAGRLKEKFNRPTVVFADSNKGEIKGSCRSTDELNIKEALDSITDHILRHGGHAKAAGLSIAKSELAAFTNAICDAAAPFVNGMANVTAIDAVVTSEELTEQLIAELRILEPYGEGFPEPLFGLTANCNKVLYMGSEEQHAKLVDAEHKLSIIKWNAAEEFKKMDSLPKKFVGYPSLNEWHGDVSVQFIVA